MQQFRADLHIHSRYSRATSKALTARHLAAWAKAKGLDVLGTGDCTHPEWLAELKDALEEDSASGLYRLRDATGLDRELPFPDAVPSGGKTLFMLQGEISSIYKRGGKVRKVHNLVFMPTFAAAERLNAKLAQVGNITSDGRPILGLDARHLLEMVLETDPLAFLVPAHIWTPWFSLFGSKSGFDSIEECFGDLSQHIFALETGLSSDPDMNWQWSALDRFRLISNSDAHSGEKLAREANLFSGEISYEGIFRALRGEALGHKFLGTLEFFPEEGKYHLDGHRKCGVMLEPRETRARGGLCPVCGKPLTVGVLHRVLELADRDAPVQPAGQPGFVSLIPLQEVVGEVLGRGPGTKAVKALYGQLVARFGSELAVLQDTPLEDIARVSRPLAEGLGRMRRGQVLRKPGFDGEFGTISVFSDKERRELTQGRMVAVPGTPSQDNAPGADTARPAPLDNGTDAPMGGHAAPPDAVDFNPAQRQAIEAGPGPVLVLAGPGTGKTQTLMGRVQALMDNGENPRHILAVTFTRRAAKEMGKRLVAVFGENVTLPRADTLHALAFEYWCTAFEEAPVLLDEDSARRIFDEANSGLPAAAIKAAWQAVNLCRERREPVPDDCTALYHAYVKHKDSWNLADYTDLLELWLEKIDNDIYMNPYTHVLVDEVQDMSALQLAVLRGLMPKGGQGFFAIGDPNQSIYGFRGAHGDVAAMLRGFWPDLATVQLTDNYRSAQEILDAAASLFPDAPALTARAGGAGAIRLFEAPSAQSEAAWIAEQVRGLLGQTSHSLADAGQDAGAGADALRGTLAPGDIAVLVRFKALIPTIKNTLERLGLPCAAPETEGFWAEPRVAMLLGAAGNFLGLSTLSADNGTDVLTCPDKVIAQGPLGIAAYVRDVPPFDDLFWKSRAFKKLVRAYDEAGGWAALINWVHLQSALEMVRARAEKVQVMSMHAAKGLEFTAVFLPGLEDGILPFAGPGFLSGKLESKAETAGLDRPDEAEERRLFYVGLTRAGRALYLSRASKRTLYGREMRLPPSRLLQELPQALLKRSTLVPHTQRKEKQLGLF
ncbi:MAG: UvrD-helicase domain-containing protein [Desulfovibrionaceae bacterium]